MSNGLELYTENGEISFSADTVNPTYLTTLHIPANTEGSFDVRGFGYVTALGFITPVVPQTWVTESFDTPDMPRLRQSGSILTWKRPVLHGFNPAQRPRPTRACNLHVYGFQVI